MTMPELNASFSLFPAQEKKSERSPDYGGVIEIPADQIDAWWRTSAQSLRTTGKTSLS